MLEANHSKPVFMCASQGTPHPPTGLPRMFLSTFHTALGITALLDEATSPQDDLLHRHPSNTLAFSLAHTRLLCLQDCLPGI